MNKKIFYLPVLVVISIIIGINLKMSDAKDNTFLTEELNTNSNAYKKINDKVSNLIKENGVFLLHTGEGSVTYLIFDGNHMSIKNESPNFSDVKIENNHNSIIINFSEELINYTVGEYPEHRLIYKIIKDNDTEYIKAFKNGEETHFDSVIL